MGDNQSPDVTDNRTKISNILFCAALTIELLLMVLEKSDYPLGFESYVFRVTFVLTLGAVVIARHDLKGWIAIAVVTAFTGFCYLYSGKNDLLRLAMFLMACKNIDLKKAMKYSLYVSVVGFFAIALLSVAGILGNVVRTMDYGREAGVETRYVFGFGHPNTLLGCVYALFLMWLWVYGKKAGALLYVVACAVTLPVVWITGSRTGIIIFVFTIVIAVIARVFTKLSEQKWIYYASGAGIFLLSAVLAPIAAVLAHSVFKGGWNPLGEEGFWKLDYLLSNRISNLYYGVPDYMGLLRNWKLIAPGSNDGYFDMGWNRLYYWYGILPTALIILAVLAVIYESMKLKDIWALVLIVSLGIYTFVEATFVTRFLGRDFFLLIGGVYLCRLFAEKDFSI